MGVIEGARRVPKQGLYWYFLGLEELILCMMEDYVEKIRQDNMLWCLVDVHMFFSLFGPCTCTPQE